MANLDWADWDWVEKEFGPKWVELGMSAWLNLAFKPHNFRRWFEDFQRGH